ncbi:MAG: hypothetical protein ACRYGK_02070, partial [Janthinobacterium lividum]
RLTKNLAAIPFAMGSSEHQPFDYSRNRERIFSAYQILASCYASDAATALREARSMQSCLASLVKDVEASFDLQELMSEEVFQKRPALLQALCEEVAGLGTAISVLRRQAEAAEPPGLSSHSPVAVRTPVSPRGQRDKSEKSRIRIKLRQGAQSLSDSLSEAYHAVSSPLKSPRHPLAAGTRSRVSEDEQESASSPLKSPRHRPSATRSRGSEEARHAASSLESASAGSNAVLSPPSLPGLVSPNRRDRKAPWASPGPAPAPISPRRTQVDFSHSVDVLTSETSAVRETPSPRRLARRIREQPAASGSTAAPASHSNLNSAGNSTTGSPAVASHTQAGFMAASEQTSSSGETRRELFGAHRRQSLGPTQSPRPGSPLTGSGSVGSSAARQSGRKREREDSDTADASTPQRTGKVARNAHEQSPGSASRTLSPLWLDSTGTSTLAEMALTLAGQLHAAAADQAPGTGTGTRAELPARQHAAAGANAVPESTATAMKGVSK